MQEMNLSLRAGDHKTPPPRSVRFFNNGDDWYFNTRESNQMGPFYSKSEAKEALQRIFGKSYRRRRSKYSGRSEFHIFSLCPGRLTQSATAVLIRETDLTSTPDILSTSVSAETLFRA